MGKEQAPKAGCRWVRHFADKNKSSFINVVQGICPLKEFVCV